MIGARGGGEGTEFIYSQITLLAPTDLHVDADYHSAAQAAVTSDTQHRAQASCFIGSRPEGMCSPVTATQFTEQTSQTKQPHVPPFHKSEEERTTSPTVLIKKWSEVYRTFSMQMCLS